MSDNPSYPPPRLLEYWLKAADNALTKAIDASNRRDGVSRIEWLVLHAVQEAGPTTVPHLMTALHRFTDLEQVPAVLERLFDEAWLVDAEPDPGAVVRLRLSPAGQTRHATLLANTEAVRREAATGISVEDQALVVRVLEQMVGNLAPPSQAT
jgi:DNA-binding MarR family transcriptional regulator